jgi:hypothetical protein
LGVGAAERLRRDLRVRRQPGPQLAHAVHERLEAGGEVEDVHLAVLA